MTCQAQKAVKARLPHWEVDFAMGGQNGINLNNE
jgi:hypothetical protein